MSTIWWDSSVDGNVLHHVEVGAGFVRQAWKKTFVFLTVWETKVKSGDYRIPRTSESTQLGQQKDGAGHPSALILLLGLGYQQRLVHVIHCHVVVLEMK